MEILSRDACKKIDNDTINKIGIPSIVLMENAASSITRQLTNIGDKILIFCGTGNNGGDGLAIGRKLYLLGKKVEIILVGDESKCSFEVKTNLDIINALNISLIKVEKDKDLTPCVIEKTLEADYVIDALFGIGLNRDIKGVFKDVIKIINENAKYIISIDIPSGIDADNGKTLGTSIKADLTFSVEVMKKGFFSTNAVEMIGDVKIVNIDIPKHIKEQNSEKSYILSKEDYKAFIPIRNKTGHKGSYGKVLVVAGSKKYTGAAFLTTESAVRCGSGLVTLATHKDVSGTLREKLIEAMVIEYNDDFNFESLNEYDVIACGPGLSKSDESKVILRKIIKNTSNFLVLDADALNIISEEKELLKYLKRRCVITPHPGEMGRLVNNSIGYIEENRIDVAKKFAKENEIIVLLKGYNTVITDGEKTFINPTGNSKMATGGMGDSLTGIIASLIGQNKKVLEGSLLGAYIHGLIGDNLSRERAVINGRDIIEKLPITIEKLCDK